MTHRAGFLRALSESEAFAVEISEMTILRRRRALVPHLATTLVLAIGSSWGGPGRAVTPPQEPSAKLSASAPEFQVNSYTQDRQFNPSVDSHDGGFVVVWQSTGSGFDDSSGTSVQGRRLDEGGQPIGAELQINTYTTVNQSTPRVAAWSDGRFVVTWASAAGAIHTRLFDSGGSPLGGDFVVATSTSYVGKPVVEVLDDSFLVVWTEFGPDGGGFGLSGRRYSSDGAPLGATFQVNSYTTGAQNQPSLRRTPDQEYLVAWVSDGSSGDDTSLTSVQLRRLASDGTPLGSDIQVNTHTSGFVFDPQIDVAEDGSYLVAWFAESSPESDDSGATLARRFDSVGDAIGSEFQVNSYTSGYQYAAAVRASLDGGFVVAWYGTATGSADSDGYAVFLHRYDSDGASVGGDLLANTLTTGNQQEPTLAPSSRGDFLVAWESNVSSGTDDSGSSIQARFFAAQADVGVSLDDGVTTATPGESLTYTLVAGNDGPDAATGVQLEDLLPSALACTWASVAAGGATGHTASSSGDVDETLFLPPDATVTYTLDCEVAPDAAGTLTHTASIQAQQVDANGSNDTALDMDSLEPLTDLSIALSADPFDAEPDDMVLLVATVSNQGPSTSAGATVAVQLPAGLTFGGSSDCADSGGGAITCQVPALEPDEEVTGEVGVLVDSGVSAGTQLSIDATVAADDSDPVASNDTDSATLSVGTGIFSDGFESGDTTAWTNSIP